MQLKLHVSHEFISEPTDAKVLFGDGVAKDLKDNAVDFPLLPHSGVVIEIANDLLKSSYLFYTKNGDSGKGNYYNAEYDWKTKFTANANYVDTLADGDLAIINKSGYKPTASDTTKSKSLSAMTDFKSHGNSQLGPKIVTSKVKNFKGLKAYLFTLAHKDATVVLSGNQLTVSMAGEIVFSIILNTKSAANFYNLTSLTAMNASAAGFNTAGIGALSQVVEVSVP